MGFKDDALKDINAARPVTPEALLYRAQTYAFLHLADRIDYLINAVTSSRQWVAENSKPPADTSWLKSTE